jgi:hypothetical protein
MVACRRMRGKAQGKTARNTHRGRPVAWAHPSAARQVANRPPSALTTRENPQMNLRKRKDKTHPAKAERQMNLRIGDTAPDFEAGTTKGRLSFHDWIGDSWAVLFSHPKDFTPISEPALIGAVDRLMGDPGSARGPVPLLRRGHGLGGRARRRRALGRPVSRPAAPAVAGPVPVGPGSAAHLTGAQGLVREPSLGGPGLLDDGLPLPPAWCGRSS